jgi:hypothetical protein
MGIRRVHNLFRTTLALGYLLLGMAAVWHAPHFSQAHASIDADRHVEHEVVFDGACALCTVKTAPQLDMARQGPGPEAAPARARKASPDVFAAMTSVFTGRPRAPPAFS